MLRQFYRLARREESDVAYKAKRSVCFLAILLCSIASCSTKGSEMYVFSKESPKAAVSGGVLPSESYLFLDPTATLVPEDVLEVAERKLVEFKQRKEGLHLTITGSRNPEEFQSAKLGIPYEVLYIPQDKVMPDMSSTECELGKMYTWAFPLIINDKYVALFKVSKMMGEWKWVEMGAALGAQTIGRLERNEGIEGLPYRRAFVNSYQTNSGYIAYSEVDVPIEKGKVFHASAKKGLEEREDMKKVFEEVAGKEDLSERWN